MCVIGSDLVDLFQAAVTELSTAQSRDQSGDIQRIDRAVQDAINARRALKEHRNLCSHCAGLRLD